MLTPTLRALQVGGVIGKAGVIVKQVRDETGARIRVVEGLPNSEERVIVISAPNMAGQPTHAAQVCSVVPSVEQADSFDCAGFAACRCRDRLGYCQMKRHSPPHIMQNAKRSMRRHSIPQDGSVTVCTISLRR